MALSRIWAAFILISIAVAGIRYAFIPADKEIFSSMVTGRAGDTLRSAAPTPQTAPAPQSGHATTSAPIPSGRIGQPPTSAPAIPGQGVPPPTYRLQRADGIIGTCTNAVTLALGLIGIMALFMGLVSIAEQAGGIRFLARLTGPFFGRLFPDLPKDHPAMGHMVMNFSANLLGLDNAATPFALKAMESLQEINPDKTTASNSQIMFLCLHASGLQLIPVSIIALRASMKAPDPTDIFIHIVIATFITTRASMSIVAFRQKINLFQPVILAWVGSLSVLVGGVVLYLRTLNAEGVLSFSRALSGG